jgi:hypothetical protein
MTVIIVGGVAGGASCAARLRRVDEKAEILMVEKGPYVSDATKGSGQPGLAGHAGATTAGRRAPPDAVYSMTLECVALAGATLSHAPGRSGKGTPMIPRGLRDSGSGISLAGPPLGIRPRR